MLEIKFPDIILPETEPIAIPTAKFEIILFLTMLLQLNNRKAVQPVGP